MAKVKSELKTLKKVLKTAPPEAQAFYKTAVKASKQTARAQQLEVLRQMGLTQATTLDDKAAAGPAVTKRQQWQALKDAGHKLEAAAFFGTYGREISKDT